MYRPLPCEVKAGKSEMPGGRERLQEARCSTAPTHRPGALAIRRSAVRTPAACSAAYLENTTGSSSSVTVTWIHGYFAWNALVTSCICDDSALL